MHQPQMSLFLMDSHNDYQLLLQQDFERAARRAGFWPKVHYADRRAEIQVEQIRRSIHENESTRPKAILVCPVNERDLMSLVHDAARAGIAWVLLSRWCEAINGFRHQYANVPIFSVLPDHEEIGQIQGQQLHHLLTAGDELVYIQGPISTYTCRKRCLGLEKALADKSDFHWTRVNSDWSEFSGEVVMSAWLYRFVATRPPEFVVAAQNDAMAFGALRAIQDWTSNGSGRSLAKGVRVIGCDGSPSFGQRLVITGRLSGTVVVPSVSGRAVDEVVAATRFGKAPPAEIRVPVHSFPSLDSFATERKGRMALEGSRPRSIDHRSD